MTTMIHGWKMTGPGAVAKFEEAAAKPAQGKVLVKVAGCGVCHTDLGYLYGGVPTKHKLPLVLGHEISGVVVDAGPKAEEWLGKRVVVPAVTPCGACRFCESGRPTACRLSRMPGNDHDGGFASHVEVSAWSLCPVDFQKPASDDAPIGRAGLELWELSVVADAVTTPLQAIKRCGLKQGELAIVVGAGGVGSYAVQLARAVGAVVVALDVDAAKLERAKSLGASLVLDAKTPPKEMKKQIGAHAETSGAPPDGWRVLECSGTKPGQETAWGLLTTGGSLSVVGYTPEPSNLRLSNLMAFDATAYGNWGCDTKLYPEALAMVTSGAVKIRGLIRKESMSDAPRILDEVHHGKFQERIVLVP